jgi:hypothetical protein
MSSGLQYIKDIGAQTAPAATGLLPVGNPSTGVALPASITQVVVAGLGAAAFGALTDSAPVLVTQTWNDSNDLFTAFRINITDSASKANSLLCDLQVGGSSRFTVDKDGDAVVAGTLSVTGASTLTGNVSAGGTLSVTGVSTLTGGMVLNTATPASASATGAKGTVVWDADYIYVCTATNTWKRAAIATW